MDERLIYMLIGMTASFMAGLYFEKGKARRFLHEINRSFLSEAPMDQGDDKAAFVATTGVILSMYYNDHLIENIARGTKDRLSRIKNDKNQTQK